MMATADGIAARQRAFAALLRHTCTTLALTAATLLAACGGGGGPGSNPADGCVRNDGAQLAGPGNLLSLTIRNDTTAPRRVQLAGRVAFDGAAGGAAGAYSTLTLTDGQSPVQAGVLRAAAGGRAQGALDIGADVLLQPGAVATWHLAHAPLPAPYGWRAMLWNKAELCAL